MLELLDLHPTPSLFDQGHRIRIAIPCADADNTEPPAVELPTAARVFRGAVLDSGMVLQVARGAGRVSRAARDLGHR